MALKVRLWSRSTMVLVAMCSGLLVLPLGRAGEPSLTEYQVKSLFVLNFTKYVDWPEGSFAQPNSPIVIAVQGESKVTDEIQKVIVGRNINGRGIVLKRLASGEDAGECHILFIPAVEEKHSPNLVTRLNSGVLTVGESGSFLESGGIINLAHRSEKIALEVNLVAADKARLRLSSKLLGVASLVKGKPK